MPDSFLDSLLASHNRLCTIYPELDFIRERLSSFPYDCFLIEQIWTILHELDDDILLCAKRLSDANK